MENGIEIKTNGIQCDKAGCDYKDPTVKVEELINYLEQPCPKCGSNLLTERDYTDFMAMFNTLTALAETIPAGDPDERIVTATFSVHNGVTTIEKDYED